MRSLATLRTRINKLLEAQADESGPPSVIVCLPRNGREPDADVRPWPRLDRVGPAAVVSYRLEDGQPSSEAIASLIAGLS